MENFYFLFEDLNNWSVWDERGYTVGFMILLFSSLLYGSIFYLMLGRRGMRFSTMGSWFLFGLFNVFTVFITSIALEGFSVFELATLGDFYYEIWLFAMINALYSFIGYFFLSIGLKRFSIYSKYIPVKF
ncbi:putative membrane protein [Aquimarina sp. EL_43]|uniref:hypothetical protein n=1 Tax=unclassified Aquimarina TaxID=2627091 RepID=UPI0018CA54E8|nr:MULTISPECIES: hypothetical protein [unclassified Aquimarina]MBG6131753.1 putative membrane protein [Aquimarina sp. EL_35]MBG6149317.1 putative membrane protein [Aquimarina sp. EL_32]MBG6170420.1 putative membrane protein [Aquimarina sp. EL_43]